jgi:hypothetical protein
VELDSCPSPQRVLNFRPLQECHLSILVRTHLLRPSASLGLIVLTALSIAILIMLISLVEMVVLQLLHWGNTRQSMRASLLMNFTSSVVAIILLLLFPHPNIRNLLIAWLILVIIEGGVLTGLRPHTPRYNWVVAVLANLASYVILILPAFLFRG